MCQFQREVDVKNVRYESSMSAITDKADGRIPYLNKLYASSLISSKYENRPETEHRLP